MHKIKISEYFDSTGHRSCKRIMKEKHTLVVYVQTCSLGYALYPPEGNTEPKKPPLPKTNKAPIIINTITIGFIFFILNPPNQFVE